MLRMFGRPKNLGWARRHKNERRVGAGSTTLAEEMASDAKNGLSISIGFESPLFLPLSQESDDLLKSRINEGNRAWSAGAAPAATVSGIVAMTWIFRKFAELLTTAPIAYIDWNSFVQTGAEHRLFVWEALVSERQQDPIDILGEPPRDGLKWVIKDGVHLLFDKADALTAVNAFIDRLGQPTDIQLPANTVAVSLVHNVISWLGWSTRHVPPNSTLLVRKQNKPNWDIVPQLLDSAGEKMPVRLEECFTQKRR